MQYNLVLAKHPEIILGTRKQNAMITDNIELSEEEMLEIVAKQIKQKRSALEEFEKCNRQKYTE